MTSNGPLATSAIAATQRLLREDAVRWRVARAGLLRIAAAMASDALAASRLRVFVENEDQRRKFDPNG